MNNNKGSVHAKSPEIRIISHMNPPRFSFHFCIMYTCSPDKGTGLIMTLQVSHIVFVKEIPTKIAI